MPDRSSAGTFLPLNGSSCAAAAADSSMTSRPPDRREDLMRIPGRPAARFILVALAGLILVGGESATPSSSNVYKNIQIYNRVLASVNDKYVEKVDSKDLIFASIEGMMGVLDQHSAFLEKKQYDDLMLETQGKYGGVGISIDIRDGWLTIVAPIESTPAFNLGLRAGDRIVAIEGETTKGI